MPRSTFRFLLALAAACSRINGVMASSGSARGSFTSCTTRAAFVPSSRLASTAKANVAPLRKGSHSSLHLDGRVLSGYSGSASTSSLDMFPSASSQWLPSIITAYDETIPEYQAKEAFQDQVSLSDITSDPVLQVAFAASAVAVILLFAAKAVVTQMDEAVEKVAVDFDRVMKQKYAKKWRKFMTDDEDGDGTVSVDPEKEGDRIQRIVEEMERLRNEEPEFMERVMRDVENPF